MADIPTYKSTLTGPELDEALRNIGKVQANIEKAAGYAETAEQYGTIVEQNQAAIQAIEDNLSAVQGAAANAQSAAANAQAAAQSAQEAQTAAQQALGFRTFFSAVSPDENGDLDPSRPMTTPTAQASWTIKSKGDRIQSVGVNGFTTQAGSGDVTPGNVREISVAGQSRSVPITATGNKVVTENVPLTAPLCEGDKVESCVASGCDKTLTFTGDSEEKWTQNLQSGAWLTPVSDIAAYGSTKIYSDYLPGNTPSAVLGGTEGISPTSGGGYIQVRLPDSTAPSYYLPAHPLTVWYQSTAYTEANDIPVALETHNWSFDNFTSEDTFSGNTGSNWVYTPSRAKDKKTNGTVICSHFKGVSGNSPDIGSINKIAINANGQYVITSSYGSDSTAFKAYVSAQETAGTPVTIVYELATPAVYAHDPVELVAVPYTDSDVTAAQQLANTPSTLPYIDSADVPMLLDSIGMPEPDVTVQSDGTLDAENTQKAAEWVQETAQRLMAAPLASAPPVAGTYVVSSQDGTTVLVSLKAMQDGGDAATIGGQTLPAALLNLVYPVGSIYMSTNASSPQTFLGGTWHQIQGQFLLASSGAHPAGSTGGSEIHNHNLSDSGYAYIGVDWSSTDLNFIGDQTIAAPKSYSGSKMKNLPGFSTESGLSRVTPLGGTTDMANGMPPYLAVYMWQRTA